VGRGPHPVIALRAMRTAVISAMAVVCISLGAATVIPAALGMDHYVIVSGSMTGTYDQGSVVFDESVPVSALRVGDVITYTPPAGKGPGELITHRIFSIGRTPAGDRLFRTKGDANRAPDPWRFTLDTPTQARVVAHVPYLGYAMAALQIRQVRMIVIGVPALLIAISVFVSLGREARDEGRREAEGADLAQEYV
jgi:signal peptidase I